MVPNTEREMNGYTANHFVLFTHPTLLILFYCMADVECGSPCQIVVLNIR